MNIKNFNSASRKAALAAIAFGLVGFGASATAMANTGAVSPAPPAPVATAAQLISPAQPATPATTGCERITFSVLHNDHSGGIKLPEGPYVVWSSGMSCKAASAAFTNFLNHHQGAIPGWTGHQEAPGYGSYTNNATGQSFSVGHMADQ